MKFEIGKFYKCKDSKKMVRIVDVMRSGLAIISDMDGRLMIIDPKNENEANWEEVTG